MEGRLHSIETFGTVDGPGIRYVVFLQGCPFRCAYCHNPDTWSMSGGYLQTVDDLVEDILRYKRYIQGVTVSGGEPLMQMEFVTELFKQVKTHGLDTCLDTSGSIFNKSDQNIVDKIDKLLEHTDLVMLDIKHIDSAKHKELTGQDNTNVLDFARYLSDKNIDSYLRYVLVPTINSDVETLKNWKQFADTLKNIKKIEILPYHRLAIDKYKKLGIVYKLEDISEPTQEEINIAEKILL